MTLEAGPERGCPASRKMEKPVNDRRVTHSPGLPGACRLGERSRLGALASEMEDA